MAKDAKNNQRKGPAVKVGTEMLREMPVVPIANRGQVSSGTSAIVYAMNSRARPIQVCHYEKCVELYDGMTVWKFSLEQASMLALAMLFGRVPEMDGQTYFFGNAADDAWTPMAEATEIEALAERHRDCSYEVGDEVALARQLALPPRVYRVVGVSEDGRRADWDLVGEGDEAVREMQRRWDEQMTRWRAEQAAAKEVRTDG